MSTTISLEQRTLPSLGSTAMRLSVAAAVLGFLPGGGLACTFGEPDPRGQGGWRQDAVPADSTSGGAQGAQVADVAAVSPNPVEEENNLDPLGVSCSRPLAPEVPASWTNTEGIPAGFQIEKTQGSTHVRLELRVFDGARVAVSEYTYPADSLAPGETQQVDFASEVDPGFADRVRASGVPFGFVAGDVYAEAENDEVLATATLPQRMIHLDANGGVHTATPTEASAAYAGESEDYPELHGVYGGLLVGTDEDGENVHIALITLSSGNTAIAGDVE